MPPVQPPFKNDGPACRVCGCTQNNACLEMRPVDLTEKQKQERWAPSGIISCHWVEVLPEDGPRRLCSACSGTIDDAVEVVRRVGRMLARREEREARIVARAFILRHEQRKNLEKRG